MAKHKYLNLFQTTVEHNKAYATGGFNRPWVSCCTEDKEVYWNKPMGSVGDILYNNGIISYEADFSIGTPIGIFVIPSGFIPDSPYGRVMSLVNMDCSNPETGGLVTQSMSWGCNSIDTTLVNYSKIANGGTKTSVTTNVVGLSGFGALPSDKFSGLTYPGDTSTAYYKASNIANCLSPYLIDEDGNETFNSEYILRTTPSSTANCLSDIDGDTNAFSLTQNVYTNGQTDWKTASTIYDSRGSGATAPASCCCSRFKVGGLKWYLPSIGELAFILPRFNLINSQLQKIIDAGGLSIAYTIPDDGYYWSSTECNAQYARDISFGDGMIYNEDKGSRLKVRAFAMV